MSLAFNFRSGSLVADCRLTVDFSAVGVGGDSVFNSQLIRASIVGGITSNVNTIPMDKNTVVVIGKVSLQ
jgi:hypothetical protein